MNKAVVVCSSCKKTFEAKPEFMNIEHNYETVEVHGFRCTECSAFFVAHCFNKHLKTKVAKLKRLYRQEVACKKASRKNQLQEMRRKLTRETTAEGLALKNEIVEY